MAKKINANVTIEGIKLPIQVDTPEEEKLYRDAAAAIQQRVVKLRDMYPGLTVDKTYYAMAMLDTAVQAQRVALRQDTQPYVDMIADLEKELEELIKG